MQRQQQPSLGATKVVVNGVNCAVFDRLLWSQLRRLDQSNY